MKIYLSLLVFVLFMSKSGQAQTLQTVVDNGNTTTSAVKFFGRTDFGEAYDPIAYGAVQITRPANLNPKFHLSFIREGQMVYGMGFLYNSNVFAIQSGNDNKSLKGLFMDINGRVGIGTTVPKEELSVNGKVRAQEIKVEVGNWPDYVFKKDYQVPTLEETERHIKEKGHLPEVPSAAEVKSNGIDVGEMNARLLKKIEELTLYMIDLNKKSSIQEMKVKELQNEIKQLNSKK